MKTQTEKTTATKYVNNFTYLFHCINNKCTYQVIFLMQDIGTQTPDVLPGPGSEFINLCSSSTQLSTIFHLLMKTIYRQIKKFLALSLSDVIFIMLVNVKMPTIVGILTFMSIIDFVLN